MVKRINCTVIRSARPGGDAVRPRAFAEKLSRMADGAVRGGRDMPASCDLICYDCKGRIRTDQPAPRPRFNLSA